MGQYPAAVLTPFQGREQEVHILSDPAVKGIPVLAELFCAGVLYHVFVREPNAC